MYKFQEIGQSLVCFPDDHLRDSVSRTIQIRTEGVDKGANYLMLHMALIRIKSSSRKLAYNVLMDHIAFYFMLEVGTTLVDVLDTVHLVNYRAVHLWVDGSFIQEM